MPSSGGRPRGGDEQAGPLELKGWSGVRGQGHKRSLTLDSAAADGPHGFAFLVLTSPTGRDCGSLWLVCGQRRN